jgi:hypothetical protein
MSQILLLFCETPYLDTSIFTAVENELRGEYLEKVDELLKTPGFNISSLVDDLSKVSFAFALSRQGSNYFWSLILKSFIKLKDQISNLALENLLFVIYRLIDYLAQGVISSVGAMDKGLDESMKNLINLFNILEDKIISNKLL